MGHGDQLDGVRVDSGPVAVAGGNHLVVHREVRSELRGGFHRSVGDDFVVGAVIGDADDRAVLHRPAGQVTHAAVRALAEEVAAFQRRQRRTDGVAFRDGGHAADRIVDMFGDVYGDIAAVALSPPFLPEIAGHFGHLVDFGCQGRTIFEYGFHRFVRISWGIPARRSAERGPRPARPSSCGLRPATP